MKKTELIGIKTTKEIKEKLTKIAEEEDRSLSYIVNRMLEDYLKHLEESTR